MDNKPEKFVSAAIIYNPVNKTVLLQHRDDRPDIVSPGKWALFGGHGEPNEDPKQALIRELVEELNIRFNAEDITPVYDYFAEAHGLQRYVFLIKSSSDESNTKINEGQGFAWVPIEKALAYDLTERAAKDLKKFIETK